ncbi:MAG: hypothetical protein N4J56_005197 [Chroococcidiopsis sp. SAG 2025]|nr:hypothetical protein [Chroococcidiopsis sp. SAG 2025]
MVRCFAIADNWLLFKMVIADNLKDYTYWISFPYYQSLGTMTNIVLLVGYSIQIFADFAGYSLIAIGLAAVLGYRLPQNFNFPYVSLAVRILETLAHFIINMAKGLFILSFGRE